MEGDNMMRLKRQNRGAVLRCLHRYDGLSRKKLANELGLTPAAITKIAAELIAEGLVRETGAVSTGGVGRREITLSLQPDARFALGVWLGLGRAVLSAVRLDGSVLFSEDVLLSVPANAEATLRLLSDLLLMQIQRHAIPRERIIGLGIAVRGVIGQDRRTVKSSFDALDTNDFPICERFEALTGFSAVLSNNVRALFAAERFFSRESETGSALFVRCASGIGAAISVRGQILSGSRGQCAEIGHIPVIRHGGKPCHCGKSGCLETIASPAAIVEDAQALFSEDRTPLLYARVNGRREAVSLSDVLEAAQGGDAGAASVTDRAADAMANALKSVIYLIDPARIVLYGPIFEHPYFLSRLKAEMTVGVDAAHAVPMEKSRFNNTLEDKAAGLLAVAKYLENGGVSE